MKPSKRNSIWFQLYVDTAYNWYFRIKNSGKILFLFQLYVDTAYNWYAHNERAGT